MAVAREARERKKPRRALAALTAGGDDDPDGDAPPSEISVPGSLPTG